MPKNPYWFIIDSSVTGVTRIIQQDGGITIQTLKIDQEIFLTNAEIDVLRLLRQDDTDEGLYAPQRTANSNGVAPGDLSRPGWLSLGDMEGE